MKKIIYSLMIAFSVAITFSACTEEEVNPSAVELSNGGSSSDTGGIKK